MITGTRELRIAPAIPRIDSTNPPGVFNSISRAAAPSEFAFARARSSCPAVTGWIVSSRTNLSTRGCCAPAGAARTAAATAKPNAALASASIMACSFASLLLHCSLLCPHLPQNFFCREAVGAQLQSLVRVVAGGFETVGSQVKPGQHQVCIRRGSQRQRCLSLFARPGRVARALPHFGQAPVGLLAAAVSGNRLLIQSLRFEHQSARKIFPRLPGERMRALLRRKRFKARSLHLVQHHGGLTERYRVKPALDALQRLNARCCCRLLPRLLDRLRLAVIGPRLQVLSHLRLAAALVAVALKAHREVEVVVRRVGIRRLRLPEQRRAIV